MIHGGDETGIVPVETDSQRLWRIGHWRQDAQARHLSHKPRRDWIDLHHSVDATRAQILDCVAKPGERIDPDTADLAGSLHGHQDIVVGRRGLYADGAILQGGA
jgi:hypothetical protein